MGQIEAVRECAEPHREARREQSLYDRRARSRPVGMGKWLGAVDEQRCGRRTGYKILPWCRRRTRAAAQEYPECRNPQGRTQPAPWSSGVLRLTRLPNVREPDGRGERAHREQAEIPGMD